MYINKLRIENFRLLKKSTLDLENQKEKNLSLLIGKNNSGKTSFIMLFDKFLKSNSNFTFDDFSLELRDKIIGINDDANVFEISIKLIMEITYSEDDSLENLSDLILDLSPDINQVKILFECIIDKDKLLNEIKKIKDEDKKARFIKKNLKSFLFSKIYIFDNDENLKKENRFKLIEKDKKSIDALVNFQVIHAKRSVSSSESSESSKKVLSTIASTYFNKKTENQLSYKDLDKINSSLLEMDSTLEEAYEEYFRDFLNKSKDFLGMSDLRVVSDLESKEILTHHSKIVYGEDKESLPEHLNGLGYMNILYLLLQIEIKKEFFIEGKKDINLLFIEEPEAHTHPQMQTIFIDKIEKLLKEISFLQTFITTHSSHIVKNSNFKDIRYFHNDVSNKNIVIKNFHSELEEKYKDEEEEFKFLKQYLTIASAELFFAEKIIFIEGITEKFLLPFFIKQYDSSSPDGIKLSSQNITILEVGANAKAFRHFIEFLNIKALVITDIDTTKKKKKKGKTTYPANKVFRSTHTSNETIKHFLKAPDFKTKPEDFKSWMDKLKKNKLQKEGGLIKIAYQTKQNDYHARSFEDAFISVNLGDLKKYKDEIRGLKNRKEISTHTGKDFYDLTDKILDIKSEFASSLLWLTLTKEVVWNIPNYIEEGLSWIAKK
ncbi:ATP-dependent endonuclease [Tenacibaculum maritimum]|uniref:ATP-dependent nuclease n=1 Tax=Tenacibaculum maritimum TaxID=107401 RepID=UPI0012E5F8BF|nr:ATP-dependent endonuclease [Tenacibaculum maritimum]CAA0175709.1 ATPase AAA [Tenacibaculum maritimum]CAA0257902.1 ATPase AAA [Tenacibaculum maritimum]